MRLDLHSRYNVLDDHQHIIKGIRPVSYLLKVASGEVRPIFKVGPLNEISNLVFGGFVVGINLKELHQSPQRDLGRKCVMAKPELHSWVGIRCDFRYRLSIDTSISIAGKWALVATSPFPYNCTCIPLI